MIKKFRVVVNGKEYVVEVEDLVGEFTPKKIERRERKAVSVKREERKQVSVEGAVLAPMPGKIVSLKADVGNKVKKGDVVAVLEAMKMENEIQAQRDGTVKEIKVSVGDNVNRGDVIMVIE